MTITSSQWTTAVSGNFNVATNWTPTGIPGPSTDVFLDVAGSAYTVTSSANNTIDWLDIASNATLNVAADTFTVYSAVNPWSNADNSGTIDITAGATAGATMVFGKAGSPGADSSEIFNIGTVKLLGGATTAATLKLEAPWFGLVGGGDVVLSGDADITGGTATAVVTLENKNNTISGGGTIGGADLYVQNDVDGTINANAATVLTLSAGAAAAAADGAAIYNAGLIETTGAGGLKIVGPGNSSSTVAMFEDGTLEADGTGALTLVNAYVEGAGNVEAAVSGAKIVLDKATLSIGGTVSTVAGSSIVTVAGTSDELDTGDLENAGTITIVNNSTLLTSDTLVNTGVVTLAGGASAATLEIRGDGADFTGSGKLVLSDSANNFIIGDGSAVQLTNRSNIYGAGTIGDANLRFVNLTGALVDANQSVALNIDDNTNANENSDYNAGLIETTGAGGLTISNGFFNNAGTLEADNSILTFDNITINSGGGLVEAIGASATDGGTIVLDNSSIGDGTLKLAAGSSLVTTAGTVDTMEDTTWNQGTITVSDGSTLNVAGQHWLNSGMVVLSDSNGSATLELDGTGTGNFELQSGGSVDLANGADQIVTNGSASVLRNINNDIYGAGTIGDANMTVQNEASGEIDATGASGLTINTGSNTVSNTGTIQSDSAGGVTIDSNLYDGGKLIANTGTIDVKGDTYGGGLTEINNSAEVEFASGGTDVLFGAGASGTLRLDHSSTAGDNFYGSVTGFTGSDKIDLSDILNGTASFTYLGDTLNGTLTVTDGTHTTKLWMIGDYTQSSFALSSDGHGGTLVT